MNQEILTSLTDLTRWSKHFFEGKTSERAVFLLDGPMGAGKTQLVRTLGELFRWQEVSSPTYSLINEYGGGVVSGKIHHCDLYRIESAEELENTGFWDIFLKKSGWIFVEWSERMDISNIPKGWSVYRIRMEVSGGENRTLKIDSLF